MKTTLRKLEIAKAALMVLPAVLFGALACETDDGSGTGTSLDGGPNCTDSSPCQGDAAYDAGGGGDATPQDSNTTADPWLPFQGELNVDLGCSEGDKKFTIAGGIPTIMVSNLGDNPVLSCPATASVATCKNVTLFGKPSHTVTLTISGTTINMAATDGKGGSCSAVAKK